MADKIKVSRKVAEQIAIGIDLHHGEGNFLEFHAETAGKWGSNASILNDITTWKMAQILVNGYEVELTTEEKVLEWYDEVQAVIRKENLPFYRGMANGAREVLNLLGIEIKGINDNDD